MNLTVVDLDIFNCLLLQCCYSHFFRIIIVAHLDRTATNRQLAFGTYVHPKPRKRWRALLRKPSCNTNCLYDNPSHIVLRQCIGLEAMALLTWIPSWLSITDLY